MPETAPYRKAVSGQRLCQGEILEGLREPVVNVESIRSGGRVLVDWKQHPLAMVLTQDCDLERAFASGANLDQVLPRIKFCELSLASEMRARGKETREIGGSDVWRAVAANNHKRYHCLPAAAADADLKGTGFEELALDLRRVFTMNTPEVFFRLETLQRRSILEPPYLTSLLQRYHYYQSRVPLPGE